ncbi:rho GTPase-activating protein 3-like [Phalaenopsis equestris]|uniref:rho GTPase-activating protein 3-like n=1 Tax=Phalaenopsis equestris TaxID=78828 RepID=UPI0009E32120|nr:rho GTPase-activating protein 3-like [Phalaenopsis equestris]
MARFPFLLGFLSSSYSLSRRTPVDETDDEVVECGCSDDLISSSLIAPAVEEGGGDGREGRGQQFSIVGTVAAVLRKSLVMCSVGAGEERAGASMDIGRPTDVQHIAHVTFDRFDGFLGLPLEFQPDIPSKVPSASVSVFGVSAEYMQCSHDCRGNSVPTILLSMQRHLYSQGGLKAEGIFRINAENGQETLVREQLNKGVVPHGVDLHCLAGLIKAWFRELPNGVLDSLTPEQVMHCNTQEDCYQLVHALPRTEAALLDWAINLMADVVEHEHYNKMNARSIAMVFAPNMTQMSDPLTALIHAVQVMNFLKALVVQKLGERENEAAHAKQFHPHDFSNVAEISFMDVDRGTSTLGASKVKPFSNLCNIEDGSDSDANESFRSFEKRSDVDDGEFISGQCSPAISDFDAAKDGIKCRNGNGDAEGLLNRLNLRKGVQKLYSHPVFQLSRSSKKAGEIEAVSG